MNPSCTPNRSVACRYTLALLAALFILYNPAGAQTCPASGTTSVSTNGSTYFPGAAATVAAGSTSITLGAVTYGSVAISAWDIVLIIQMQGAQINSNNTTAYGANAGTAQGYMNNGQLLAGNMEFAIATSAVTTAGGTLTVQSGLTNSYKNTAFGATGQFRYQVIRVPLYYNVTLTATLAAPAWNGTSGGVVVLAATNNINMNGQTINASAKGFRGGGGISHSNPNLSGVNTDYRALSTALNCGTKGEGLAGTPRYIFASGNITLLDYGSGLEGYPNGCLDRGAPGNAGGGATDGAPLSNSNNAGGGGGGNGASGGGGGRSWSSQLFTGGMGGAAFAQASPSRLVMGGGGGSGSSDGGTGTPTAGLASSGAPGGGLVIIRAGSLSGTGTITANGASPNTTLLNDGAGGGGAGGSILVISASGFSGVTAHANGSDGASNTGAGSPHGTGGGGGGGIIYSTGTLNAASTVNGGAPGTTQGIVPATFGATAGTAGILQVITIGQTPTFPLMCNTLLATSFSSISASSSAENVSIYWQMDNEAEPADYTIEKSFDGAAFSVAGSIASGQHAAGTNNYTYQDVPAGNNHPVVYYRVRCTLPGRQTMLSKTVEVSNETHGTGLTVTPNPVATGAGIRFFAARGGLLSIQLTDLQGNTVLTKQYPVQQGMNSIYVYGLQSVPAGIYLLRLDDGTTHENKKLVIRH
jgi:hypothetical protein